MIPLVSIWAQYLQLSLVHLLVGILLFLTSRRDLVFLTVGLRLTVVKDWLADNSLGLKKSWMDVCVLGGWCESCGRVLMSWAGRLGVGVLGAFHLQSARTNISLRFFGLL